MGPLVGTKKGDGINNKWTKNGVSSRAHFPRKKYNNKAKNNMNTAE